MDVGEIQSTFQSKLFQSSCQDVARIVSILSMDATDVSRPPSSKSFPVQVYEKIVFLWRFFYMVFVKGFTPAIFDLLPFQVWRAITIAVYLYRLYLLPFYLRFVGYGQFVNWNEPPLGSKQPSKGSQDDKPLLQDSLVLSKESRLAVVDFGDPKYEFFITKLINMSTHLSPHSQSPNPFVAVGFPGNFFDHLTGVYKCLLAWRQPQYIVRGGMFHSVYGTFDYRFSLFDLRNGRAELASLIGTLVPRTPNIPH